MHNNKYINKAESTTMNPFLLGSTSRQYGGYILFMWLLIVVDTMMFALASSTRTRRLMIGDDNGSTKKVHHNKDDGNDDDYVDVGIPFQHFIAHNASMTCTADEHARPFNNQIRGVNLGGWMVLEPWITPSMFYQFLGGNEHNTAVDSWTFCEVLGPQEANKQLHRHWASWVTKDIIDQLAASGAVNSIRLPVGDYQFVPYGPYAGCMDGGLEYIDELLEWSYSNGISVLFDIHTMIGSQNGFDNSGKATGFAWTSILNNEFSHQTTFEHWPIRTAEWIGTFDPTTAQYTSINWDNIQHALTVIERLVDRYAGHPAVLGLEPLNEPWQYTPIDVLKRFYWEGYLIVKSKAPYWKYVMHDSFRLEPRIWGGFMDGCPERVLDTHIYQAWRDPDSRIGFYTDACQQKSILATMERVFGPVIVGEWSAATDNCAMWLNGFNDNLPGFPRLPCKYAPCRASYLPVDQPGTPLDPSKPLQGPYGSGMSGPIFGQCPCTRDWLKESSGNPLTGSDWIRAPPTAPKHLDDTDNVMKDLILKKIDAFSGIAHGFFFWNFRTELSHPQWSYMEALERGWIPRGDLNDERIRQACAREDSNSYICVLKKGQIDKAVRLALETVFTNDREIDPSSASHILNLTGAELQSAAQTVLSQYFDKYRHKGATCDFGGVAMLVEENRTQTDDDSGWSNDDEYYVRSGKNRISVVASPPLWELALYAVAIAIIAATSGFIVAMHCNKSFNKRVMSNPALFPLTRSSNQLIRSSLALPQLENYEEIRQLVK